MAARSVVRPRIEITKNIPAAPSERNGAPYFHGAPVTLSGFGTVGRNARITQP
jgi:hypothetical protein